MFNQQNLAINQDFHLALRRGWSLDKIFKAGSPALLYTCHLVRFYFFTYAILLFVEKCNFLSFEHSSKSFLKLQKTLFF